MVAVVVVEVVWRALVEQPLLDQQLAPCSIDIDDQLQQQLHATGHGLRVNWRLEEPQLEQHHSHARCNLCKFDPFVSKIHSWLCYFALIAISESR